MAHRTFRDADGTEWQVWNVVPGAWRGTDWSGEERRRQDRRSPDPVLRYAGSERRATERRASDFVVSAPLAAGWLSFESPAGRRRLTPIPSAWDTLDDAALDRLCRQASPVPARSRQPHRR